MRAVLALLWWQGATCRVTEREGVPPPSKKSKKVGCGGWNHPDSEKNTRTTVYGKIAFVCRGVKIKTNSDDDGRGTGFDDDKYENADPYVCWNKHLYEAYVGWNLVAAYMVSHGPLCMWAKITGAKKPAHDWWNTANVLVQVTCFMEGIVSYFILTSGTIGGSDSSHKCRWFVIATTPLSKTVAFPAVQAADALFRPWKDFDRMRVICEYWLPVNFGVLALCVLPFLAYSIPLYLCFIPLLMYLGLCFFLLPFHLESVLEYLLSFNRKYKTKFKEIKEKHLPDNPSWSEVDGLDEEDMHVLVVQGLATSRYVFPLAYGMLLFGIYVDPFYEKSSLWVPLTREVVLSVNPFDWENLRVAFAWPDRLPYVDQIFFAISISMACLDFVVQSLRPGTESKGTGKVMDEDAAAAAAAAVADRPEAHERALELGSSSRRADGATAEEERRRREAVPKLAELRTLKGHSSWVRCGVHCTFVMICLR